MSRSTLLVVDDEPSIRDMLSIVLDDAGFAVITASNAAEAHAEILNSKPDLVLLDWMMPETSGIELLRRLKRDELTANIPVIMLTAKLEESSTVTGLDSGADDYISKPFAHRELISRINAVLRRNHRDQNTDAIRVGDLLFDPGSHRVTIADKPIRLGPTEFRLLQFFLTHQDRVFSRNQLLDFVWGPDVYLDERTVDVHIRRLRKSLDISGYERFVHTIRGAGYMFSSSLVDI